MVIERDGGFDRRDLILGGLGLTVAAGVGRAAPPLPRSRAGTPTIFATGGTFFPPAGQRPHFPHYLINLARAPHPRVCWLGAASGEDPKAWAAFSAGMTKLGCAVRHFDLFKPETLDFVDYLMGFDIVYVNGGSSRNLMAMWRDWGFDRALRTAWADGVIMSGHSAGFICWFQSGLSQSYPKVLSPVKGMGFLSGSADPHYNMRPDRRTRFKQLIAEGLIDSPGLALDQDTAVLFRGTEMVELVSTKPGSGAYHVTRVGEIAEERALPVRYLGV